MSESDVQTPDTLRLVPVSFADACGFVAMHHRHHRPPIGHKFSLGVALGDVLVGVAMVGRPVARMYDDGTTLEVNRTATDGTKNANSMLYGAAWRAAKALGYGRLITYTQEGDRAVYDAWCGDEERCDHEHGGWFEYVHSPADVMDRLAHLGRLRIKAIL
jgi:hypothetical protein